MQTIDAKITIENPQIAQINALIRIARNAWLVLLTSLVFVTVILMSIEHIDFYGVDRSTKLPIVDIKVPTRMFFYVAPLLITAAYGYFHFYLIRLWEQLGTADCRVEENGDCLANSISPWIVTDSALYLRALFRKDDCVTRRPLEATAMIINIFLSWVFGLNVLAYSWTNTLPARDMIMSAVNAGALMMCFSVGYVSFTVMILNMRRANAPTHDVTRSNWFRIPFVASMLMFMLISAFQTGSFTRSMHPAAPLDLSHSQLALRPEGWRPYGMARDEFLQTWCGRRPSECDQGKPLSQDHFQEAWRQHYRVQIEDLEKPNWPLSDPHFPDFRSANLSYSFLTGAILAGRDLSGANLRWTVLEGANLRGASFNQSTFLHTRFHRADATGADFANAKLWKSEFIQSRLNDVNLHGTELSFTFFQGTEAEPITFAKADLTASVNHGGALRYLDLRDMTFDALTDFRNVFLDGTVLLPKGFADAMGTPCQWSTERLSDEEYFGRWRWWIESKPNDFALAPGRYIAPVGWSLVASFPPADQSCVWKTEPKNLQH